MADAPKVTWFGEPWGAPGCSPESHVETPVGQACHWCAHLIRRGERGLILNDADEGDAPFHEKCFVDAALHADQALN